MVATLLLWTVVACSKNHCVQDWRPMAQFDTPALCESAKRDLGVHTGNRARCVLSSSKKATND